MRGKTIVVMMLCKQINKSVKLSSGLGEVELLE